MGGITDDSMWLVDRYLPCTSFCSLVCSLLSLHAALFRSLAICLRRSLSLSDLLHSDKGLHQLKWRQSRLLSPSPLAIIKHFPKICCHIAPSPSSPLTRNCSNTKELLGLSGLRSRPSNSKDSFTRSIHGKVFGFFLLLFLAVKSNIQWNISNVKRNIWLQAADSSIPSIKILLPMN